MPTATQSAIYPATGYHRHYPFWFIGGEVPNLEELHPSEPLSEKDADKFIDEAPTPEDEFLTKEMKEVVRRALLSVPPRIARVLSMRNGIGCEEHTFDQIGEKFGLTRERIRQMEAKGHRLLKNRLRKTAYDPTSYRERIMRERSEAAEWERTRPEREKRMEAARKADEEWRAAKKERDAIEIAEMQARFKEWKERRDKEDAELAANREAAAAYRFNLCLGADRHDWVFKWGTLVTSSKFPEQVMQVDSYAYHVNGEKVVNCIFRKNGNWFCGQFRVSNLTAVEGNQVYPRQEIPRYSGRVW